MPSWIVNEFLSPDAISIGRLVWNVDHPEQDFYAPKPGFITPENIASVNYQNYEEVLERAEGTKLSAFLTNLFSFSKDGSKSASSEIQSKVCITYQLKNSGSFFKKLCNDPEARDWIKDSFELNKDVYLVVGLRTVTDAHVILRNQSSSKLAADAKIPIEEVLQGAGVVVPPGLIGGAGASASSSDSASINSQFHAPGEYVYAAQFRKLKFRLFARREVDNAFLEDANQWKIYPSSEGARGPFAHGKRDEDSAQVVEVELGEEQAGGNDDDMGLKGDKADRFELDGDDIVYISKKRDDSDRV